MIVKEHDYINFSMRAEIGVRRYYSKEVLCKDGRLIIRIDNCEIPLNEIFHIEIVGNSHPKSNDIF